MSEQCNHWNDRIDPEGKTMLRPVRCAREMEHEGPHALGDTSWGELLGYRAPTAHPTDQGQRQDAGGSL